MSSLKVIIVAKKESRSGSENANTAIWNELVATPAEYLKQFKKAGGFSGKSIDPTYRIKRLTELFGPCGKGWGFVQEDQWSDAGSGAYVVYVRGYLWYTDLETGERYNTNSHTGGTVCDRAPDEAYKMAETDALGKCTLDIGLSADVYMGEHDGDKYQRDESGTLFVPPSIGGGSSRRPAGSKPASGVERAAKAAEPIKPGAGVSSVLEEVSGLQDEVQAHSYSKAIFSRLLGSKGLDSKEVSAIAERVLAKRAELVTEAMLPNLRSTADAFVKQGWVSSDFAAKTVVLCERKLGIAPTAKG